jgi:hypothetical protein
MFKLPQYTWDKDRELCKRCKHYRPSIDRPRLYSGALVMRCAVNPFTASKGIGTCIDNRTRGPCGKDGKLFEPKQPTPPQELVINLPKFV